MAGRTVTSMNNRVGHLQVIAGPMFSGKSEELLRRVRRARIAGQKVAVVHHSLDTRHGTDLVTSHAGASVPSTPIPDAAGVASFAHGKALNLLAIDEAQFFDDDLIGVVEEIVRRGTTVVVAGLCVTWDARPFDPIPSLMALAEDVVKLTAICNVCGADAAFHQRSVAGEAGNPLQPVAAHVGGAETYQARCRRHLA